ncbi:hypothetical protein DM01DRAFT_1277774, partial [Hesseltinella vesiculosa]
ILKKVIPETQKDVLLEEFKSWKQALDCTEFWREGRRIRALAVVDDICADTVNSRFVASSQDLK